MWKIRSVQICISFQVSGHSGLSAERYKKLPLMDSMNFINLDQMLKKFAPGLFISSLLLSISVADDGFPSCNCEEEGFWSTENILEWQRVSDFLIAVAYFSIPIELLYFLSCSNLPFRWVIFQFVAFIVLCGLTHFLNGWTYGPHTFHIMLALTIFKFLTALVSCATAITLITLIPLLLKVKVREFMLKMKARELGREVGIIKKKKETGLHVRMLTQEIRKSLDRHTILYTTLVELSETLDLQNCAVWMPNEEKTEMNLTHELKSRNFCNRSIPIADPDVIMIKGSDGVRLLNPDSALASASRGEPEEPGSVAAIRMPMLRVCNFKGGTPELIQACYAILVLVLPGGESRSWSAQEVEIIKVVADQVAVALSHAAVLEESQFMREKLVVQNRALQQAQKYALMASQARNSFQKVISNEMRRPMHSISGLLSLMQTGDLSNEQKSVVNAMVKGSNVLSTLINDVMEMSTKDYRVRIPLGMKPFQLHSLIREMASVTKCLCVYSGVDFAFEAEKSLPNWVMGDETRVFQVIMHMVRNVLNVGGDVTFRVFSESGSSGCNDQRWAAWKSTLSDGYVCIRFEVGIKKGSSPLKGPISTSQFFGLRCNSDGTDRQLSFKLLKELVQLMQGNIQIIPSPPQGFFAQNISLLLRFQKCPSRGRGTGIAISEPKESSDQTHSPSIFRGLQVLLADDDDANRAVTQKLLEKLGCAVSTAFSGYECLTAISSATSPFQVALLELHMRDLDGYEVTTRIRKFRSHSRPLIIGVAATGEDSRERCSQGGMDGFVCKPITLREISDELRRVVMPRTGRVLS